MGVIMDWLAGRGPMKTTQTQNTSSRSTSSPWAGAMPGINQAMASTAGALGSIPGAYAPIMAQAGQPGAASTYLQDTASGANINGGSPQFNAALNYQSGQLADDVNRGFSGMGRYGSGAHAGVLGDTVGNFRNQAMSGEIARQQQLQQTAAGTISQEEMARLGLQGGLLGQQYGQQFQGAGVLGNFGALGGTTSSRGTGTVQEPPVPGWQRILGAGATIAGAFF